MVCPGRTRLASRLPASDPSCATGSVIVRSTLPSLPSSMAIVTVPAATVIVIERRGSVIPQPPWVGRPFGPKLVPPCVATV